MKTRDFLSGLVLAGTAVLLFGGAPDISARVVTVGIANGNALMFFPAVTNIATGDQVWVWNNTSNLHSTTGTGLWDSGLQASPFTFTNTFNTAGNFPYFCSRHVGFGMTGEVLVAAVSLPPAINITNPLSGAVFAAPANVNIRAAATNGSGTITNVQFLVGATLLTNKTAAPYSANANNLAANRYTLSVIATDNNGLNATNTVGISVVTPVPLALGSPQQLSASSFQFSYSANAGLSYIVQRSTSLAAPDWITLGTNQAAGNPVTFVDTNAVANPGFYRVGLLPNP